MREHGEAVEADLREHYGVRLRDLFLRDADGHQRMTWRELRCYIRQLPSTARTRIATGDDDSIWGLQEHLTAVVIDELRVANWQRANEGAEKSKQSPRPKPFPRPGVGGKKAADKNSPERQAARQRALRRAADRKQAIAQGLIR
ncbi:hypothetical protein [Streptomyces achromogenes]|uniref:hypothetical protein n=1 Tax=Streptomyces achromogenes TaxID=67255 RepID=UPI00369808A3